MYINIHIKRTSIYIIKNFSFQLIMMTKLKMYIIQIIHKNLIRKQLNTEKLKKIV